MSAAGLETWVVAWGYAAIFAAVLLDDIGVPVPEEIVLLVPGYLAWRGAPAIPAVILVGVLSAVVGDGIGYRLGRMGGRPLLGRYGRSILVLSRQIRRAEPFFARHGRRVVFFGRFLAGIRFLVGPPAGIARMPFRRFLMCNASGVLVYVPVVILGGYGARRHLHAVLGAAQRVGHLVLLLLALLLAGLAWRAWQRAKD